MVTAFAILAMFYIYIYVYAYKHSTFCFHHPTFVTRLEYEEEKIIVCIIFARCYCSYHIYKVLLFASYLQGATVRQVAPRLNTLPLIGDFSSRDLWHDLSWKPMQPELKPIASSFSFATFPNKASRLLESLKQSPEYEESFFFQFLQFLQFSNSPISPISSNF